MSDCSFCPPLRDVGEVVASNGHCLFVMRDEPVLEGSGLIIPKAHRETVFDLTAAERVATLELVDRAKAILDERFRPDGYNVGWNAGSVAGQEVAHCHLHVIPRFSDEPLAGRGIRYWLKQETNRRR